MADREDYLWAGGGGWTPDPPPDPPAAPKPEPPRTKPTPATPLPKLGPSPPQGKSGLVCGRFLPLHRGHTMLLEYARDSVEKLTVLVFAQEDDPIPAHARVAWLRAQMPSLEIDAVIGPRPDPEAPDFAARFLAACRSWQPRGERLFFSSESSGRVAAEALGATLVYVDPARVIVPISGTMLREELLTHYDYLASAARPCFVRRVVVLGAESTGKSTLCQQLAEQYDTTFVPEYARTLAALQGGRLERNDVEAAARGQIDAEEEAAAIASRLLFCDTDVLTMELWHTRLFSTAASPWLRQQAAARRYDLYLHCWTDVPFVGAAERDRPLERAAFARRLDDELRRRGAAPLVTLDGTWSERLQKARAAIDALLARGGFLAARADRIFQELREAGAPHPSGTL